MKEQRHLSESVDPSLVAQLASHRYTNITKKAGAVCAIAPFLYTTGLVVGLNKLEYERRYCYEHETDARQALAAWDGIGHPGGPWIKCKGTGVDLINPAWSQAADVRPPARATPRATGERPPDKRT